MITWFKIALAVLLCFVFAMPARADSTVFVVVWEYPEGIRIDPALVSVEVTGGTVTFVDAAPQGGTVLFTTPYDRACYRVTIQADNRTYASANDSECFKTALPLVSDG